MEKFIQLIKDKLGKKVELVFDKKYLSDYVGAIQGNADVLVKAESTEDVAAALKLAYENDVNIVIRGAGTNLVASTVPEGGLILDVSNIKEIGQIDEFNQSIEVGCGVKLCDLQNFVESKGWFYPPDPAEKEATIGGNISTNAGGMRAVKYGVTRDYIRELEFVTPQGNIIKLGADTIKDSTGLNLKHLVIGSEGTLGIVVEATLKLIPKPQSKKVLMAYFDTVKDAVKAVNALVEQRIYPATIDFMDKNAIQTVEKFYPANLLIDKESALIIEIDGFECSMKYQEDIIMNTLKSCNASAIQASHNEAEYNKIWTARRSSMGACAKLKPNVTTDDVIVPRENLEALVLGIRKICEKYNLDVCMVGHVGDGSVHPQIPIDYNDEDEYNRYKLAKSEIYDLTAKLGGILSGEHGIGVVKRDYIGKVVNSTALDYMRNIKKIFDPNNILNPYKIF